MCRLRSLIALSALGCLSLAGCSSDGPSGPARVVILADTHVIGPQYTTAVENSAADNESILLTPARLRAARDRIHAMVPLPDAVVILGDVVHAAHHAHDIAWYRENRSAFTVTKEILDTFEMPVHVLMGNHDYEVNCDGGESYDRALSEALFREFFGAEPYYEVTYGGVRLYLLNGQQGATWDVNSPACDTGRASFGATQLDWLDRGLSDGRPSIVMSHYMGVLWASGETPDVPERADLNNVLAAHDNVAMYLAGHTHRPERALWPRALRDRTGTLRRRQLLGARARRRRRPHRDPRSRQGDLVELVRAHVQLRSGPDVDRRRRRDGHVRDGLRRLLKHSWMDAARVSYRSRRCPHPKTSVRSSGARPSWPVRARARLP
jgi:predicted phosphodiesterase